MSISKIFHNLHLEESVITIGMFDGVHIGHQQIIECLKSKTAQSGAPSCLVTFHPHPAFILKNLNEPFYLTTPQERASILFGLGIDHVITIPFSHELSQFTPDQFIGLLNQHLSIKHLCVGSDFALGKNRTGDPQKLKEIGEQMGFTMETVQPLQRYDQKVSSSFIRKLIQEKQLETATELLGRYYSISGQINELSYLNFSKPFIAHLQITYETLKMTPPDGLYAATIDLASGEIPALVKVTSIDDKTSHVHPSRKIEVYSINEQKAETGRNIIIKFHCSLSDSFEPSMLEDKITQLATNFRDISKGCTI